MAESGAGETSHGRFPEQHAGAADGRRCLPLRGHQQETDSGVFNHVGLQNCKERQHWRSDVGLKWT